MAIVRFTDGRNEAISRELSHKVWFILNGELGPTEEQEQYCSMIEKIYLNRHYAPVSYLEANHEILRVMK